MNLHVDLIVASERRSASPLNTRSVRRVLLVVGPVAALLLAGSLVVDFLQLKWQLSMLETQWSNTEPRKAEADALRNQVSENSDVLAEVRGIKASRIPIRDVLAGVLIETPRTIQLRGLTANQFPTLEPGGGLARHGSLSVNGKVSGAQAEEEVSTLRRRFAEAPVFTQLVATAVVAEYGPDPARGAGRDDRTFRIDCDFKPRPFVE